MSARKLANVSQRSQTRMPAPPFRWYALTLGLRHFVSMFAQQWYADERGRPDVCPAVCPWTVDRLAVTSRRKHPQFAVSPHSRSGPVAMISVPHSHRQRHFLGYFVSPKRNRTVSRPNSSPVRSRAHLGMTSAAFRGYQTEPKRAPAAALLVNGRRTARVAASPAGIWCAQTTEQFIQRFHRRKPAQHMRGPLIHSQRSSQVVGRPIGRLRLSVSAWPSQRISRRHGCWLRVSPYRSYGRSAGSCAPRYGRARPPR